MPDQVPIQFLSISGSLLLILGGIVWRSLVIRIDNLEAKHAGLPLSILLADVAVIKKDIEWLKNIFIEDVPRHGKNI